MATHIFVPHSRNINSWRNDGRRIRRNRRSAPGAPKEEGETLILRRREGKRTGLVTNCVGGDKRLYRYGGGNLTRGGRWWGS